MKGPVIKKSSNKLKIPERMKYKKLTRKQLKQLEYEKKREKERLIKEKLKKIKENFQNSEAIISPILSKIINNIRDMFT